MARLTVQLRATEVVSCLWMLSLQPRKPSKHKSEDVRVHVLVFQDVTTLVVLRLDHQIQQVLVLRSLCCQLASPSLTPASRFALFCLIISLILAQSPS